VSIFVSGLGMRFTYLSAWGRPMIDLGVANRIWNKLFTLQLRSPS